MKRSNRLLVLILVCSISTQHSYSQKSHSTIRPWKAVIHLNTNAKIKGTLYNITDSSVFVQGLGIRPDEIKLSDIHRMKVVPDYGKGTRRVVGFLVGATAGAIVASEALSNGKSGEPRAIGGVTGGIGGGLVGGIIGFTAWPALYNGVASKRITIKHNPEFYQSLRQKLYSYSIQGQ
jgi:hypothetical protein